ncbi:hypothetical protein HFN80_28570 [Rhizobium laguerreae]|uniref:hypothetical protein n=1 Tax=Rhizobium laguerreae TaxID=1076926 RepID=UPI001C92AF65|nr:hypothetical protein [Rhizobium laguerreae]MBY3467900.1 hypothetical protein [Rhizobium laguerreae]
MSDGAVLDWNAAGHPTAQVTDIARRSSFLTHTALRELIYNPSGPDEPNNIFKIAVEHLIGDFDAILEGGNRRSVAELWKDLQSAYSAQVTTSKGKRRPQHYIKNMENACSLFNEGMRQALDALEVEAKRLLRRLLDVLAADPLDLVGLTFAQLTYSEEKRAILNQSLVAPIRVRTHAVHAPQNFLNEGRQTALALALYLAGRRVCAPPGRAQLKLLVMDDLLISLDASHRRPVLDLILSEFEDWQIILLTHDRYWFQLAREQVAPTGAWKTIEIYERFDGDGLLLPLVRSVPDYLGDATLSQAEDFLADNHAPAAANYARSACEILLKRFCAKKGVPLPYFEDERRPDLNSLLTEAKKHVAGDVNRLKALTDLEAHKRYVLNPLSMTRQIQFLPPTLRQLLPRCVRLAKLAAKTIHSRGVRPASAWRPGLFKCATALAVNLFTCLAMVTPEFTPTFIVERNPD